jgi:hypothetical protein
MNLAEYSSCDGVALFQPSKKRETSPKELAALLWKPWKSESSNQCDN